MRTLLATPLEVKSTWSGAKLGMASRANTDHTGQQSTSALQEAISSSQTPPGAPNESLDNTL